MPIREFQCECGKRYERIVSVSEEKDLQECPECGTMGNNRLPAMVGAYHITGDNSASTRPRGGAFKRKGKNG